MRDTEWDLLLLHARLPVGWQEGRMGCSGMFSSRGIPRCPRSCHEASRIPVGLAACVRGQIHFRDLAKARTDRASSAPLLLWRLRCALHYSGQLKHVEIPPHSHRTSSRRTAPISKHLHPNTSLHPTPTCRRSRKFHRSIIETNIKKHRDRRNALHQR